MQQGFDRHDRVRALIGELAAEFIRSEANTDPLITVTNTTTSSDYRSATIYVTTIPDSKEQDALAFLQRSARDFRTFLKRKSELKVIPHITFAIDAGERHRQHIDDITRDIEREKRD